LDDLKAVGDAFKGMRLVGEQHGSFIHTGCIGEIVEFQDFLKRDDSTHKHQDAMDVSVMRKDIIVESSVHRSFDNSTITDSMDCTTFNDETITTFDTGVLDNGSTFSDCSSSYNFSDEDSSTEDNDRKMKHRNPGVKKPKMMRRIIKSPTARTTTAAASTNGANNTALAVSKSEPVWKAVQYVGETRANRSRRRDAFA
jgi:hypothetical protein